MWKTTFIRISRGAKGFKTTYRPKERFPAFGRLADKLDRSRASGLHGLVALKLLHALQNGSHMLVICHGLKVRTVIHKSNKSREDGQNEMPEHRHCLGW